MADLSGQITDRFVEVYSSLTRHNLVELEALYHADVVFEDPAHRVVGWPNLQDYFTRLFRAVTECRFEIHDSLADQNTAYIQWTMVFSHPRLASGSSRSVHGCSRLEFKDGQVIYHRDYFDMGEMIYEGIPLIGSFLRRVKASL